MADDRISRRKLLGAGAALAGTLGACGRQVLEPSADALLTKPVPSTGEQLPVIGLGTNAFGVEGESEIAALQTVVEAMVAAGGSIIDTARMYGASELVIGKILARSGLRKRVFISTKTPASGPLDDPDAEIDAAFERLGVDVIDLMLIHNLHGTAVYLPAMQRAKETGRLRYIGMSTSRDDQYDEQMAAMRRYPLDFIQVDYSITDRSSEREMLPLAQDLGLAVLANSPFGGRRNAGETFGRVRGVALPDWATTIGATSWAQVFLKYAVSHPAVTAAIPGSTELRHLSDNQQAGRGRLPDRALRAEIETFWTRL